MSAIYHGCIHLVKELRCSSDPTSGEDPAFSNSGGDRIKFPLEGPRGERFGTGSVEA